MKTNEYETFIFIMYFLFVSYKAATFMGYVGVVLHYSVAANLLKMSVNSIEKSVSYISVIQRL